MKELELLFSQHSLEELIIFIVLFLMIVQGVWKMIEFFLEKYELHTGKRINNVK
jgi:F0F1-type ATP synthase membrane subunit b/b'